MPDAPPEIQADAPSSAPSISSAAPTPVLHDVHPTPTDEELAAILAAIEVAWPRPAAAPVVEVAPRWRFSGRWWSRPLPARRARP